MNLKNYFGKLDEYNKVNAEKEELEKVNAVLEGLDELDEEQQIKDNAVKMNNLLNSEKLVTTITDDMDDAAEDFINNSKQNDLPNTNISGNNEYTF